MKTSLRALVLLLCLALGTGALGGCRKPSAPSRETSLGTTSATVTEDCTETEYDPAHYVVIRSAEDLMAFNRAVNQDEYAFDGMTVIFLEDVDMEDYLWQPLNGACLDGVTFDGQGHTLRGLRLPDYEYPADPPVSDGEKGCGFIGVATADVTFRHLTLEGTRVNAYDHSVGNFIGAVRGGTARFEDCHSLDFTAEGWKDWQNRDPSTGGHAVALRMGGFVGYVGRGGAAEFRDCTVKGLTLSGFQNLAGFVGYDGSGTLTAAHFSNCTVQNARLTFSYPIAEGYEEDEPERLVAVFYNAVDWRDTLDACLASGNRYEDVIYYDWADDGAAYTPENFRAWRRKEAQHD